jgi:hypothetical protein
MKQRMEILHKQHEQRMAKKRKEKLEAERSQIAERRNALLEHIQKPLLNTDLKWKDIQQEDDIRRKERIEKRKLELLSQTSCPFPPGYDAAWQSRHNGVPAKPPTGPTITAKQSIEAMAKRNEESVQRREKRLAAKREKEEAEKRMKQEENRKRMEKILNEKVPEQSRKLTKSAEERANTVSKHGDDASYFCVV